MKLLLVLLLATASNFVFADDGIEDLKEACSNPGAYHNQMPPSDIKIHCKDERVEWEATGPEDATIHNSRTVCSKAMTNKPSVNEELPDTCEPCNWPGSDFQCGGFKEVAKDVEMEFSVTCDQVLAMVAINKYCQEQMLAETIATKETILSTKATGKVFKTCENKIYMNDKPTNEKPPVMFKSKLR